ncbi:AAA family ATPase [Lacibacterium aquatile]|uniref:AAA family ATPase n=1 Tax=Lacibacterium aquatile TaxID=1168082 RepID=A0ABW5DQH5_9PROT
MTYGLPDLPPSSDEVADKLPDLDTIEKAKIESLRAQALRGSEGLLKWPTILPDGTEISRPELGAIQANFDSAPVTTTALLGPPGAGKSAFMARLSRDLLAKGWSVLAIKADQLHPDVKTEADLQKALGFAEFPSTVIRQMSLLGPVVLLIDQLDALASILDRHTQRLDVLLALARSVKAQPRVHVVMSCRAFEFSHDTRLAALSAEQLTLELPTLEQVAPIMLKQGIDIGNWPDDAKEVIRSPQALDIYLKLAPTLHSEPFRSYQTLLERLWSERVIKGAKPKESEALAAKIAAEIADQESLWLGKARYEHEEGFDELLAARILVLSSDGLSVGFSHQTLFEHALARGFVRESGSLSEKVLKSQSSLFLRSRIWAALAYLRAAEPVSYAKELWQIWDTQGLRSHLKLLLIDFAGQQRDPNDIEKQLMVDALAMPEHREAAFSSMAGSPGWFRIHRATIAAEMRGKNSVLMVRLLLPAWSFAPTEVEQLVLQQWSIEGFERQVWSVIGLAPHWSPAIVNLATSVIACGNIPMGSVESYVATLGVEQPQEALRLVRARLDKDLERASVEARRRAEERPAEPSEDMAAQIVWRLEHDRKKPVEDLLDSGKDFYVLPALVESQPGPYAETLWPWFDAVFTRLKELVEEAPRWGFALPYSGNFDIEADGGTGWRSEGLIGLFSLSLELLAKQDKAAFQVWLRRLWDYDVCVVQRILANALASDQEHYADLALEFLTTDYRRLMLGSTGNSLSTTSRLIRVSSPLWSPEQLAAFERWVWAFEPVVDPEFPSETREEFIRNMQVRVFFALPKALRSSAIETLLVPEEPPPIHRPSADEATPSIGSLVSSEEMVAMTDDGILALFNEVPYRTGSEHPREVLKGGNDQLFQELVEFVQRDVGRGIAIINRMDPVIAQRAVGLALEKLAQDKVDPKIVMDLFAQTSVRGFNSGEFRRSAAYAIERITENGIEPTEAVLEVLEGWLQEPLMVEGPQQPAEEESDDVEEFDEVFRELNPPPAAQSYNGHSPLWGNGLIGSDPGKMFPIVFALAQARLQLKQVERLIGSLTSFLAQSKDLSVWQSMLRSFCFPDFWAQPEVAKPFLRALFQHQPGLLGTEGAAQLLAHAQQWAPDVVGEILVNWPLQKSEVAQVAYGELVGLAYMLHPDLAWVQERFADILAQPAASLARVGAARSVAHAWPVPDYRERAIATLAQLLERNETSVWQAALDLFRLIEELSADPPTARLLQLVAVSIEHIDDFQDLFLVERLGDFLPAEARTIARIVEGLARKAVDPNFGLDGSYNSVGDLFNLAYTLHRLEPTKDDGTRIFEILLQAGDFQAGDSVYTLDGRFKPQHIPSRVRPRLRRRPRKSPLAWRGKGANATPE